MNLYDEQFDEKHDRPRFEGLPKFYVIASTPRSGSHMFGHALKETKLLGHPLEYFQKANFEKWKRRLNTVGVEDTLRELVRRRTSPNGVFGLKLHFDHVGRVGGPQGLERHFPNAQYFLINRLGIVEQAVSYAIAAQNGIWINGQKPISDTANYSFELIDKKLRKILRDTNGWRYLLATKGLPFSELSYESIAHDIPTYVKLVATKLNIDLPESSIPSKAPTKPQARALNEQWRQRFLEDQSEQWRPIDPPEQTPSRALRTALKRLLQRAIQPS